MLDQFVIIFGGFNSKAETLVSNDLYVLSLNGEYNAMLPKAHEKKQLQALAKKKVAEKPVVKKPTTPTEETKEVAPIAPEASIVPVAPVAKP